MFSLGGKSRDNRPTVTIEDREWPVRLVRHAAARSYRLILDANRGELRLTLPCRASERSALQWARAQQDWLAAQLGKAADLVPVGPGAMLPLFGVMRQIVGDATRPRRIEILPDKLIVGGPTEQLGKRLERWIRREAQDILSRESHALAGTIGRAIGRIGVGDPRSRWGSCSAAGDLRYSWRLILAPDHVRQATVAHEVAHLVHMHHGPEFHALVDHLYDGDVAVARDWLRREGRSLHRYRFE